ncbi:MAG: glycosyltransferase [Candidatus Eisenbacteria bacterium]
MKVLLSGAFHPRGTLAYYERAFRKLNVPVTYSGIPYGFERPGYAADTDLNELPGQGVCDWFMYIEDMVQRPVFPLGLAETKYPTVGYFPDAALDLSRRKVMALFFDYVFVASKWAVEPLRRVNPNTFYLPFAYDPECVPYRRQEYRYDVAFVGSVYGDRKDLLAQVASEFKMNDYAGRATPEEIGEIYSASKIVFNRPPPRGLDYNMRVFEAMGCGSLLLTERLPEDPLFTPGEHLITYDDSKDCIELIRYYLANEEERARIARQGQEAVRSGHMYTHRLQTVIRILEQTGFQRCAPIREADVNQRFLSYQRVFSRMMMLDSMADMFGEPDVSATARIRALPLVGAAVGRRTRRMFWRKLAESMLGRSNNGS